jgi:hypothetical protein
MWIERPLILVPGILESSLAIENFFRHHGIYKIPEIQTQYAKIKNELEAIDYKKAMAKYELQNINNNNMKFKMNR